MTQALAQCYLLFCCWAGEIKLPEEILEITSLAVRPKWVYILDRKTRTIYQLNSSGKIQKKLIGKTGQGPGCMNFPRNITLQGDNLLLCDLERMKISQYTSDLALVKEVYLKGIPFCIYSDQKFIFIVSHQNEKIVQILDPQLNQISAFGRGFETEPEYQRFFTGSQGGHLLSLDGQVYFLHFILPVIQQFDPFNGKEVDIPIPLTFPKNIRRLEDIPFSFQKFFQQSGFLYLEVLDTSERRYFLLRYNPRDGSWKRLKGIARLVADDSGTPFQIREDDDENPIALVPIQLEISQSAR